MRRVIVTGILATVLLQLLASVALAGPEWCDTGSPPPNDFRFRPTGSGSAGSSTSWLNSTTGGTLDLATGTNTLQGGVAQGMQQAIAHVGPKVPAPTK